MQSHVKCRPNQDRSCWLSLGQEGSRCHTDRMVAVCDSHGSAQFPFRLSPLPPPLLISFSFLWFTSFYQFFNYFHNFFSSPYLLVSCFFILVCHCPSIWFFCFPFSTTNVILIRDSSVTWPIVGSHHKPTSKCTPSNLFLRESGKKADPVERTLLGLYPGSSLQIAVLP